MSYGYPIDLRDLMRCIDARGPAYREHVGIEAAMRPDEILTAVAWSVGTGWFPCTARREWKGALDMGLPDVPGLPSATCRGMEVKAVADGTVVFVDGTAHSREGFDLSRAIVEHQGPNGEVFYYQYKHLGFAEVVRGQRVSTGETLGHIGWHGRFPHVEISVASPDPVGGDELTPEYDGDALGTLRDDEIWGVLRVRVRKLDPTDWPLSLFFPTPNVRALPSTPFYILNPIEVVRYCLGDAYEHHVGHATPHQVAPQPKPVLDGLKPRTSLVVPVPEVLASTPLRASTVLQDAARNPAASLTRAQRNDPGVVKALQLALLACGLDVGKRGANGKPEPALWKALETFQRGKLKEHVDAAGPEGILGKTAADISPRAVDWLTIVGLDACAAALEGIPRPNPYAPPAAPPPRPHGPALAATPQNTFDATKGTTSLHFGMRMYQSLLRWENQVGYSALYGEYDGAFASFKPLCPEWPRMPFDPTAFITVEGHTYPVYQRLGVGFHGTDYVNCSSSQLAAFTVALGGELFAVKTAAGKVTYDMRTAAADPLQLVTTFRYDAKKGEWSPRTEKKLFVFEQLVSNVDLYSRQDLASHIAGSDWKKRLGTLNGVSFLGIGEAVCVDTSDQDDLKQLRVGDLANIPGHAFMVGDVRYAVFLKGRGGVVPRVAQYVVDQSCFVHPAVPFLQRVDRWNDRVDPWKNYAAQAGPRPMNHADCQAVSEAEKDFDDHVRTFLATTELPDPARPSQVLPVARIAVVCLRWLSSNSRKTNGRRTLDPADGVGITRPWRAVSRMSASRLYPPEAP